MSHYKLLLMPYNIPRCRTERSGSGFDSRIASVSFKSANSTQVYEGRDRDLNAGRHVELMDPAQVHEGSVHDGRLVATAYAKRVNPTQVHKSCVRDDRLVAVSHGKGLNPDQVHEDRIREVRSEA